MSENIGQKGRQLTVETRWAHVFKTMFSSLDVAKMGAHAFAIYMAAKVHSDMKTGISFPSIDTLIEITGISRAQVYRSLTTLEDMKYIKRIEKRGRHNRYILLEKFPIRDEDGHLLHVARLAYAGESIKRTVKRLTDMVNAGAVAGNASMHIENLQFNIVQANDRAVVINLQADTAGLPKQLKATLEQLGRKMMADGLCTALAETYQEETFLEK